MFGWNHGGSWGWGAWVGMSLVMLLFWGAVIWFVVTLLRSSSRDGAPPLEAGPEDVLAGRLSHGDIDEEQYRRSMRALRGEPATSLVKAEVKKSGA